MRGDPITVYGDGRQTRSFCFVSDLVEVLYRLIKTLCESEPELGLEQGLKKTIDWFEEREK